MRAMVRKEFAQLRRDRRSVALLVAVPLLMLVVFGYVARFDVEVIRAAVVGPGAEQVAAAAPDDIDVLDVAPADGRDAAVERLRSGDFDVVVVADPAAPQVLVDGTQLFAARNVVAAASAGALPGQVEILFNPDLESTPVMIPGLVGMILVFVGTLATSLGVVRERQAGTLEQLAVMPLRPRDVIAGKLAPYLVIALLDIVLVTLIGGAVFDVPFRGSPYVFALGAVLFLFVTLSVGVLISTVSQNQGQAVQLALIVMLPQLMLSGFIFPVSAMAAPLQALARILPLTWFIEMARGVVLRGAALADVALPLVILAGMGMVVVTAALARFRRDLAPAGAI